MVMTMTAMQSLLDSKMMYLDLVSGVGGVLLANELKRGPTNLCLCVAGLVLLSRVITDGLYHHLVSKTAKFGGSNLEFLASTVVWFLLVSVVKRQFKLNLSYKQTWVLFGSTMLVMMATARVTHWG